jgi:hypothetical protein
LAWWAGSASRIAPGSEQANSGWIIARPAVGISQPHPTNPQLRIFLDQLLNQTEVPLLKTTPAPPTPRNSSAMRMAERKYGVTEWRSAGVAPAASSPLQIPGVQLWQPVRDANGAHDDGRPPIANAVESGGPVLEFRPPAHQETHESTRGDAQECESAPVADSRPVEPLPSAEKLPELLPGNDRSSSDVDADRPVAHTPVDDEFDVTTVDEPILSEKSTDVDEAEPQEKAQQTAPAATAPVSPQPPLTPQLKSLRTRVRSVLKGYYMKPLNSQEHDPWEVMHGMLAYGVHSRIRQGGPRGDYITAVGWLCYNRPCKGQTLLYVSPEGHLRAKQGVGLQGHMGQLLAMLAQCHVAPDYPIRVGDRDYTIEDLIEAEQATCYPKTELTFKLIALSHYLDLDATWVNDQGLEWDMPRLIREEIAQPIRGAACGGTHRLSGLSLAVKARRKSGEPLDGEYARAAEFVKNYQNYAFRLQNRDGSLSTKWFQGSGDESDIDRRVKTTGHILEWLVYSLSDEELRDQRTIRSVSYLANLLYSNYSHEWEVGPVCHATHALLLYDERVFQPFDPPGQSVVTKDGPSNTAGNRGSSARR